MLTRRQAAIGAAALLPGSAAAQPARGPAVVASFSVLADVVRVVSGGTAQVNALVGPNQDAHHYDARPTDAALLTRATLVVRNGLNFDRWLDPMLAAAPYRGRVVTAAEGVTPILVRDTIPDPHVWQSFENAAIYARNVEAGLAAVRPREAAAYARNRAAFVREIDALAGEARALFAAVPQNRRMIVVPHNSFRYLGRELGLTFRGVRALNTNESISAQDLAKLIDDIRAAGAAAAFFENITDPRLIERVARESGARVGGRLYSDALSEPNGPAGTYLAMLRHNVRVIAAALA